MATNFYGGRTPLFNATGVGAKRIEDPRQSGIGMVRGMYNGQPQQQRNFSTLTNKSSPLLSTSFNPNERFSKPAQITSRPPTSFNPNERFSQPVKNKSKTPPNHSNNLLNYILSPQGKGMAQGLLESSGYSTMPVGMGQALSQGMARSNEASATAEDNAFKREQYEFNKKMLEADLDFKKESTKASNKLQKSIIEIKQDSQKLAEEEFTYIKDNPEAKSTLGNLKTDFNKGILTLDEYNKGIASATGIKDPTIVQTIKWMAESSFDGDIKKATDKYFNSKTQDKGTYERDTLKILLDNPHYKPEEVFEISQYMANQAYAEKLIIKDGITDISKIKAGNYYMHPQSGLIQAQFKDNILVPVKVEAPESMQTKKSKN